MGFFDLFKPKGDTISGSIKAIGESAKDIREAITGDIPPELRVKLYNKSLEIEAKSLELQSNVIISEAQGNSWLQRNWRPVTMIVFLFLTVADAFGWLPNRLAPEAWTVLQIGLGGYVVGRSGEKIVSKLKE